MERVVIALKTFSLEDGSETEEQKVLKKLREKGGKVRGLRPEITMNVVMKTALIRF